VPVDLSHDLLEPLVDIEIEDSKYKMFVDLGSIRYGLHLEDRALKKIKNKELVGDGEFGDIRGNIYRCSEFRIPEIKIGREFVLDPTATMQDRQFLQNVRLFSGPDVDKRIEDRIERVDGKIGLPIFRNYNCLFDFPNSVIVLYKSVVDMEKLYPPDHFVRVPFSVEKYGVVLSVETDVGIERMVLDTGSTYSMINKSLIKEPNDWIYSTNKLVIEGCNYGSWELALFDISDKWDIHGCLGADFFLEYAICLDFENNIAYIQRPAKFALLTQWKRLKLRATQMCKTALRRSKMVLAQGEGSIDITVEVDWDFLHGFPPSFDH
jgi:hypothetical protein